MFSSAACYLSLGSFRHLLESGSDRKNNSVLTLFRPGYLVFGELAGGGEGEGRITSQNPKQR